MRFIVDAQLPPALARWLVEAGHNARHVEEVGLREAEDIPIWRYALDNNAVVITKDEDFADRARRSPQSPAIIWNNPNTVTPNQPTKLAERLPRSPNPVSG